MDSWIDFSKCFGPISKQAVYPIMGMSPYDAEATREGIEALHRALESLERHLEGREWLVGSAITLADLTVAFEALNPWLGLYDSEMQDKYLNCTRWFKAVYAHIVVQKTFP